MERRTFVKGAGFAGAVAVGGIGLTALTGSATAESHVAITSENVEVDDSRGQVDEVWVQPDLDIEWDHFSEAPGKIFTYIEANVGDRSEGGPQDDGFWPVFRMTLWSTPATVVADEESTSGPGPSGDYTTDMSEWAPRVLIADKDGIPDYGDHDDLDDDDDVYDYLTARNTFGIDGDAFRDYDEEWGYYGPAAHVEAFDAEDDGSEATTAVELRYTFAFRTVNTGMLNGYIELEGTWDPENVDAIEDRLADADPRATLDEVFDAEEFVEPEDWDEADYGEIADFWSRVQVAEVTTTDTDDSAGGASVQVMNGGAYDDITQDGASSASDNYVPAHQAIAGDHPAIIETSSSFDVTVDNIEGEGEVDGESNTGGAGASDDEGVEEDADDET